jgi:hypothetical protein
VQYLLTTKKTLVNRENLVECKKIMDLYVHQIKVFNDDCIDILFKIPLGADKDGVGGTTIIHPHSFRLCRGKRTL